MMRLRLHIISQLQDRYVVLNKKIKALETAKAKVALLEEKIAAERNAVLAGLPAQFGFDSVNSFIAAVNAASGKRRGRKPGEKAAAPSVAKPRRRARITEEMRAEVKKLAEAGKTGGEIAKAIGISLPSVQNIKKTFGLVKRRKA